MAFSLIARTPMRAIAWISLWALLSHAARPDDDHEQAGSLIETVASGHMVRSGFSKKASRKSLAMETQGTEGPETTAATETPASKYHIPKEGGKLGNGGDEAALVKALKEAQAAYVEAAKKTWGKEGTDMKDNFIEKQGDMWMKAVEQFKFQAQELRKEAERIYKAMVKSHTESAQTMMLTMKKEMSKLKNLNAYSKSMKQAIDTVPKVEDMDPQHTYYETTVPGQNKNPINAADALKQTIAYAKDDNAEHMYVPGQLKDETREVAEAEDSPRP